MTKRAMQRAIVILAAGKGSRMGGGRAKVLFEMAGAPLLWHVMRGARGVAGRLIVVTGHLGEQVGAAARRWAEVDVVQQAEQNGTAHAALATRDALDGFDGGVFIVYGDTPFVSAARLEQMAAACEEGGVSPDIAVLAFETSEPTGYGRVIEHGGEVCAIVEERDANAEQRAITLCNSGVFYLRAPLLFELLAQVGKDNAKGEYYLTDIVALARANGHKTCAVRCAESETLGINTPHDLARAAAQYQHARRAHFMDNGVIMDAPETVYFAYDTELGRDVHIEPNVVFGAGVRVEDGANIRAFSHLEGCHIGAGAVVGPYARLRLGAEIGADARIGNFVEVKASQIAAGAKVNHLSYIGDSAIGAGANIGAGVITCNYDGVAKHRTVVGAGAFVGSNAALVAPVAIGAGAVVGSGSVITGDVAADALALGRGRQVNKEGAGARLMARNKAKDKAKDKAKHKAKNAKKGAD